MSNWDLMMPGMGLTAIGIAGVTISYAGIAHTFIDGMHALTGLTMMIGLIFLSAGILDGGVSTSNRAKATTLVVLAISLSFGAAALVFNSITSIPTFIGVMLIIAVPAIVMAYVSMKMPQYAKPIGVIFVIATGAAISAYVGFGLYGPSQYLVPAAEEVTEIEKPVPIPSAPITAISILKGSSNQGSPDYEPDLASVPLGNNIEWMNYDEVPHSVTSAADVGATFDSSLINAGEKYLLDTSKLKPDTYDYFCIIHPFMKASFVYAKESGMETNTAPMQSETIVETPAEETIVETPAEEIENQTTSEDSNVASSSSSIIIEIPEGSSANTNCDNNCFSPNNVSIQVGGTIIWKNLDVAAHAQSDSNQSFDTGMIMAGSTAETKFNSSGTYEYFCYLHPWMKGKIIVG